MNSVLQIRPLVHQMVFNQIKKVRNPKVINPKLKKVGEKVNNSLRFQRILSLVEVFLILIVHKSHMDKMKFNNPALHMMTKLQNQPNKQKERKLKSRKIRKNSN